MAYRIVVAEDNPGDVYLLRHALNETGVPAELTVFDDGAEALRFFEREGSGAERSDLILLDLNLPKRDGFEILAAIRARGRFEHVPVVILTSSRSAQDRARAADLKATAYLLKPLNLAEFVQIGVAIKRLLEQEHGPPNRLAQSSQKTSDRHD